MTTLLAIQPTANQAVPFDMRGQPQRRTLDNSRDNVRLNRYRELWSFFVGKHWSFRRANGGQLVTANYCRMIVLKKAGWLAGKGVTLDVPQALTEITKPRLAEVWRQNDEQAQHFEIAVSGGVTGDVFILVTATPPTTQHLIENPGAQYMVRIQVLRPDQCFPTWDPRDTKKMTSIEIVTEMVVLPDGTVSDAASNGNETYRKRYVQRITASEIQEGFEGEAPTVRRNDLGEIPVVHIANEKVPGEFYGLSDLDGIIDLQRELNEKLTDVSDIVHAYASPVTIITGAKAKSLDKSTGSVWGGLPADAKVFNLELSGDLGASHRYVELVRQIMFDIAGMPEGALGRIQAISNTSAAALEVQFQPLVESRDRKKAQYEPALERVNYFILRYLQIVDKLTFPSDLCEACGGRIVQYASTDRAGRPVVRKKCYHINKQTLDFLHPDEMRLSMTVEHSFGTEVRKVPYRTIRRLWEKKHTSFWDPEGMVDEEKQAERDKERAEAQQAEGQRKALEQREAENVIDRGPEEEEETEEAT